MHRREQTVQCGGQEGSEAALQLVSGWCGDGGGGGGEADSSASRDMRPVASPAGASCTQQHHHDP